MMTITRVGDGRDLAGGRRLPLKALAALFFLVLSGLILLAACGGDDEQSTETPQGTRTAVATAAATGTRAAIATPVAGATETAPAATEVAIGTAPPSSGTIDPCALLTRGEVEAALGTSVTEPEAEESANLVACTYGDPDNPIFSLLSVTVLIADNANDASDIYELAKDNAAEAETVGGIGNDAFWDSVLNGLEVLEGKYDIRIDVSPDGGDELAIARGLAPKVLDRLP